MTDPTPQARDIDGDRQLDFNEFVRLLVDIREQIVLEKAAAEDPEKSREGDGMYQAAAGRMRHSIFVSLRLPTQLQSSTL